MGGVVVGRLGHGLQVKRHTITCACNMQTHARRRTHQWVLDAQTQRAQLLALSASTESEGTCNTFCTNPDEPCPRLRIMCSSSGKISELARAALRCSKSRLCAAAFSSALLAALPEAEGV